MDYFHCDWVTLHERIDYRDWTRALLYLKKKAEIERELMKRRAEEGERHTRS